MVKLGGSLLDLVELRPRLIAYLRSLHPVWPMLVVGGGRDVDAIRARDGELSADEAHWSAIEVMSANARRLATILDAPLHTSLAVPTTNRHVYTTVLDAYALLRESEHNGRPPLPRSWDVTSDAIAAQLAHDVGAGSLILLKSRSIPKDWTLEQAAREGVVDAYLPVIARELNVSVVNFRQEPSAVCCRWPASHAQAEPSDAR